MVTIPENKVLSSRLFQLADDYHSVTRQFLGAIQWYILQNRLAELIFFNCIFR